MLPGECSGSESSIHFPVAFPEVRPREAPGFDRIVGNPPWEKVKAEEHNFWGLRFPGLRSPCGGAANRDGQTRR